MKSVLNEFESRMTALSTTGRVRAALDRLIDAVADPQRRGRAVALLLVAYTAVWTLYGVIAKSSQDIHFDMGEAVAWSREVTFGTPKHPPMSAWLVGAWFKVMPLADWSYYLFAIVLAAASLWIAWRAIVDHLPAEKQAAGLALLTLVPFYNVQALKFNANTVMTPFWALTTWAFLRSFETRSIAFAALAGLGAAGAMLGKYWSVILLLGLGLAALADPRRGAYLRSAAPWVTAGAGALGLAPHLAWLAADNFSVFGYSLESHPATTAQALASGLGYIAGALGYAALPILLVLLTARPTSPALADTAWPADAPRRLVLLCFVLPLLLPVAAAAAAAQNVVSLWAIGGMTLLPVVLLGSPQLAMPRDAARWIVGVALALPLVLLALSPAIAVYIHRQGVSNFADQYRLVAGAVEERWRAATPAPLTIVGSYNNLLYGMLIYVPGRPTTYEFVSPTLTPWVDEARIARDGIAMVCPANEPPCTVAMDRLAAKLRVVVRSEVEIARTYLGMTGMPQRYMIVVAPPG